ncbi:recombinase RecT [Polynucleobacter sp. MWH-UH24A]|uniref:recombinase RecT n=1 Tax=Polynucleobacter sp. MWH-UH24A TaxID=2689110 RepID=UPI001BFE3995|nr:recombinase RecT [Polynucleobacter sp. MWH-UH24A]QWD76444.1 recombinase RecT [Polynucleobacter sp. MWH-UH24A]
MKRVSILDLPEDLLDGDQSHRPSEPTLDTLVTKVANTLAITSQELSHWAKEAVVPEEALKLILRTALRFKLSPLLGQIDWELNLDGGYEVYIPIDGWVAMIHREPNFKGLTFSQATETEEGIPIWMECSIYRADLIQPITVREYYTELKTDHPIWMQMPRRMLRHKTLQQCARLAFGISVPELKIPNAPAIMEKPTMVRVGHSALNRKELLRQKIG